MKEIELINYRCFTQLRIYFKPHINVLVGDNASGKTTILKAIKSVLSSFFTGYSDENTRFIGLSTQDFTRLPTDNGLANFKPIELKFDLLGLQASMRLESEKAGSSKRTATRLLSNIKQYGQRLKNNLFNEQQQQTEELPLFACFSTEDIHSSRKLSPGSFKTYFHKPSFGYYECLNGEGLFPYWIKRLLVLKEGNKGETEIQGVRQALRKALGTEGCNIIKDIQIRPNQGKVYYIFTDDREVETDNLSDGYRRLINIVTDIAFRCMLLNQGIYGEEAYFRTKGTVLIDEIDLHLHTSLQTSVLKGLRVAFPQLQFIVSTHAPMVMTGIEPDENNIIYRLSYAGDNQYTVAPIQLYGMDASSIIESALHTIPRVQDVDDELNVLFSLIDEEQLAEARIKLEQLQNAFGDSLPELAKAETMLNFLDNDEEDQ
jgi:predicted ATP-binding protein involved in virulence